MLKSPQGCGPSAPSSSRRQRTELSESRDPCERELPILEGTAPCAAAGGVGDSALATSAPTWGPRGSLPPSPNGEQRNPEVVKEKGKGDQGKGESSGRPNGSHVSVEGERPPLPPLANAASKAGPGPLVPLWPEALAESSPRPREGHLAKDGPGLGGQELGERGRRPPVSLTEHKPLGEVLDLALPPSPSGEGGRLKGSGAPNDRFSNTDKGRQTQPELSGGKKLPASPAPTGRKASLPRVTLPETKAAPREVKRPETHPEAGQEAGLKSRGNLEGNMLEAVQVIHALGKKKEEVAAAVPTPQGITEIQEQPAAPAGALQTAPEALRLPPLPSPSRDMDQANGFGASKASVVQVDRGMQGQGKLCPDKAPAACGAQGEEEAAAGKSKHKSKDKTKSKSKRHDPESSQKDSRKLQSSGSSERLKSGKNNHKLSGQPATEISEPVEDLEEALAKILESVRLPPLLSPLREVEEPKGLGATKDSVVQVDKGMQVQGKLCPDTAPADRRAEAKEEGAVPGKNRGKDDPEPSQQDSRKLQSSGSSHRLESGKSKHKLSGETKIEDLQPTTAMSALLEAPEEALAIAPEAVRLPALLSPIREMQQRKSLGDPKDSSDPMDRELQVQTKVSGGKKLPASPATTGRKAALTEGKRPENHPEAGQEAGLKARGTLGKQVLDNVHVIHALDKKEDVAAADPTPQGITEIQGQPAAPAGALQTAPEALRLPPLPSPSRDLDQANGIGASKASVLQVDRAMQVRGKLCPDKAPAACGAEGEEEAAVGKSKHKHKSKPKHKSKSKRHDPESSQKDDRKLQSSVSTHRLDSGKSNYKLSGETKNEGFQPTTEMSALLEATEEALAIAPEAERLPSLLSPLREMQQCKSLGDPKDSSDPMDRELQVQTKVSGGKKLPASPATPGRKAALLEGKRPENHPEAGQEAGLKARGTLGKQVLDNVHVIHALDKKEDVAAADPTPQGITEIQGQPAAPAGALQTAPEALRLPPLPSPSRNLDQANGLGASKASVLQVDRAMQGQGKLCPDKAPAACGAEGEEEAAAGKRKHKHKSKHKSKRKRHHPEPSQEDGRKLQSSGSSERLESGKKHGNLSGQSQIEDRQPATDISGRLEALEETVAKLLEALRLPTPLSPLRGVEQLKGPGATNISVVQVDKGIQVQGKLYADKAPADFGAEAEEEGAVPRKKRRKDHPEPSQENGRKPRSSGSSHRLKSRKNKHKLSGQTKIQGGQPTTEITGCLEASEEALAIAREALALAREALRLPPLPCPSRDLDQAKGLGASKASVVPVDKGMDEGMQVQGKLCPDKAPADCGAGTEGEGAVPGKTRGKDHPEPSQEEGRKYRSSGSSHRLESGKKEDKVSGQTKVQGPQPTTEMSERVEAPAGASGIAPAALCLPPLHSLSWKVDKPKGPGPPQDSRDQMDRGPRLPRKCSPQKSPRRSAQPGQKAPLPGDQKQPSPEAGKKDRGALGRRMPESVQQLHTPGKREDRRPSPVRELQPPAQAHVHLPAPAAVWETAPEAARFPTAHFPSRSVEQPRDIRNTEARGRQADRELRGPPKPWRDRGQSERGAEPPEEAAPLTNKRKSDLPEPSGQVWKKLRTCLSDNMPEAPQKQDKLAGSFGVPRSPAKARDRGRTTGEWPPPRQSQAGFWAAARDRSQKAQDEWAPPFRTEPAQWVPRARWSPAPRRWRDERERLKRMAQREREFAAKYTALGKKNFFEERFKDMEIASRYGYMV